MLETRHNHRLVWHGLHQTHLLSTYHATHHTSSRRLAHDRAATFLVSQTASSNMVNGTTLRARLSCFASAQASKSFGRRAVPDHRAVWHTVPRRCLRPRSLPCALPQPLLAPWYCAASQSSWAQPCSRSSPWRRPLHSRAISTRSTSGSMNFTMRTTIPPRSWKRRSLRRPSRPASEPITQTTAPRSTTWPV